MSPAEKNAETLRNFRVLRDSGDDVRATIFYKANQAAIDAASRDEHNAARAAENADDAQRAKSLGPAHERRREVARLHGEGAARAYEAINAYQLRLERRRAEENGDSAA